MEVEGEERDLLKSASKFRIDSKTGVISIVGDIDREEVDTFRFTVVATDQAQPAACRLLAERVVTMIVEDIIDNSPEFVTVPTGLLFGQVGAAGVVLLQCGPVTQMLTI